MVAEVERAFLDEPSDNPKLVGVWGVGAAVKGLDRSPGDLRALKAFVLGAMSGLFAVGAGLLPRELLKSI